MDPKALEASVLDCNRSDNRHLRDVIEEALVNPSRRSILRGGTGLAALAAAPLLPGCSSAESVPVLAEAQTRLGFPAVRKSLEDRVIVPPGYSVKVVHATGDRISASVPAYSNAGSESDDWSLRVGDHHDGMDFFYIGANGRVSATPTDRAVLAVNHESSADAHFFHPQGQTSGGVAGKKFSQFGEWDTLPRPGLEVLKEINHHGVSVVELQKDASGIFSTYRVDSPLNRRVTAQTVCRIEGPAAHLSAIRQQMVTRYDPTGATSRGTLNNCGHGITPWGTYLGCEENWAFYMNMPAGSPAVDARTSAARARYGVARAPIAPNARNSISQGWFTPTDLPDADFRFSRWNIAPVGSSASEDFRNEPNTFGYNVEIDPADPQAVPAKRVAMGRFAHEGAWSSLPVPGQPLAFYMGCDSRNEYIYKFVTAANWDPADFGAGMAAGDKYLNEGKLYAARFNADGRGEWVELTIDDPRIRNYAAFRFETQADVYIHTRHAADAVGATKMDRPEWGAVNPANGEVYFTLTNNSAANRAPGRTDAANPRAYADPAGRRGSGNPNGHIIRFREEGDVATALRFQWDIFLFGSEASHPVTQVNLSRLTAQNSFSSPDGLWFSKVTGILWIQTDDGAYTDETNNMLLAAIPGRVGDGAKVVVDNQLNNASALQETFLGGLLGEARLRRFLVGVPGCEITGITETADGKTLFVNVQHPGENTPARGNEASWRFESNFPGNAGYGPGGADARPRSATLVITKDDGGVIGL